MFNFSSDPATDLAANRNGVLDPAQKNRLRAQLLAAFAPVVLLGLVVGMIWLVILPLFFLDMGADLPWIMLIFLGLPLAGLVWGLVTGLLERYWKYGLALVELLTSEPTVQFADGDLTWRGRGYAARGEGYPLALPPQADWLPGNYRFYLLPRSRLIVSADRVHGEVDTAAEVNRALQSTIGFTPEDVQANHQNRLGNRQRLTLLGHTLPLLGLILVVSGFSLLPIVMFAGEFEGEVSFIAIVFLGSLAFFFGVMALVALPLARDMLSGEVIAWEGFTYKRAVTTGSGRSRSTSYYYEVNGQRARVTRAAYDALVPGHRYRVFVAAVSKRVVAAEWLS